MILITVRRERGKREKYRRCLEPSIEKADLHVGMNLRIRNN